MVSQGRAEMYIQRVHYKFLEIISTAQLHHEANELLWCPRDHVSRDETV